MTTTPETPTEDKSSKPARLDLRTLVERLRLPGVDTQKLVSLYRKDLEALIAANEKAIVAVETLGKKRVEYLTNVLKEWSAGVRETIAETSGAEKLNQASARVQRAFSGALSNLREMAEITAKSSEEVLAILNTRYREGVEEFRASLRRPKS